MTKTMTDKEYKFGKMEMAYADGFTAYEMGKLESASEQYSDYPEANALWVEGFIEAEKIHMIVLLGETA